MLNDTSQSTQAPSKLFRLLIIGLLPLSVCVGVLFVMVVSRTVQLEREFKARQTEFQKEWAQWRAQSINDYQVLYSNCGPYGMCCKDVTLHVEEGALVEPLPACAANFNGYYYIYARAASVDETFAGMEIWMQQNPRHYIEITYHPDLHYITQLRFEPWENSGDSVIEYSNLRPE